MPSSSSRCHPFSKYSARQLLCPKAQAYQVSLGADESQGFDDDDDDDEKLYRQLEEEFPTELADDIDPEGREFTMEDLVMAKGSIPESLRNELHSDDVWGPPVRPELFCGCLHSASVKPHAYLSAYPRCCLVIYYVQPLSRCSAFTSMMHPLRRDCDKCLCVQAVNVQLPCK